jgi:enterochelin esterase-like enzyme
VSGRPRRLRTVPVAVPLALLLTALAVGCSWPKRERWELAPLPPDGVELTRLVTGPPLHLDRIRFHSAEVGEPRFFLALVPAGVDRVEDVLIFNHGWWDRPEDLLRELKIDQVHARLLAARKTRPAILVLPDIRFSNDHRRNAERYPFNQTLELIATEVSGLVSQRYGVAPDRNHWSIGGFSFGGYVALDVARRFSSRFGSASVFSAFHDKEWTFWPAEPPPAGKLDSRGRGKQTIVAPGPVPRLLLGCGTDDRLYTSMVELHELLTARGIGHEWRTAPGGHTWEYWSSVLEPMLLFHLGTDLSRAVGES